MSKFYVLPAISVTNVSKTGRVIVLGIYHSKETLHGFLNLLNFHLLDSFHLFWIRAESINWPYMSKEGNLWKLELHIVWIQSQIVLPTCFHKVQESVVIFLVIFVLLSYSLSCACSIGIIFLLIPSTLHVVGRN